MSKNVSVIVTDDLDGSDNAETVSFGFDGVTYEIDLAKKNRAKLEKALAPYIEAGRRVPRGGRRAGGRAGGASADRSAVRAWAKSAGLEVSDRGRVSAEIMRQYEAAHKPAAAAARRAHGGSRCSFLVPRLPSAGIPRQRLGRLRAWHSSGRPAADPACFGRADALPHARPVTAIAGDRGPVFPQRRGQLPGPAGSWLPRPWPSSRNCITRRGPGRSKLPPPGPVTVDIRASSGQHRSTTGVIVRGPGG